MNRKYYRKIARKAGLSVVEVKSEMQQALDEAYKNPTQAVLGIPRKESVPTPDEYIDYVVGELNKSEK